MLVTVSLDGLFAENGLLARCTGKWAVVNAWPKPNY